MNNALPERVDITVDELRELGDIQIIDIRNPDEVAAQPLPCKHVHIPMDELLQTPLRLDKDRTYVLVCAAGVRTQYVANAFRSAGYHRIYSLIGGNRMIKA